MIMKDVDSNDYSYASVSTAWLYDWWNRYKMVSLSSRLVDVFEFKQDAIQLFEEAVKMQVHSG